MTDVTELRARIERLAVDQRAKRKTAAADMPLSQAIVDGLRAAGINPAWVRFTEAGHTLDGGRRTKDRVVPSIPGVPR